MKIKSLLTVGLIAITVAACSSKKEAPEYVLNVEIGNNDVDGTTAVLVDYDTNDTINTTIVADGKAVFSGVLEQPVAARLSINGTRNGVVILEADSITMINGVIDSPLNQEYANVFKEISALGESLSSQITTDTPEAERDSIINLYRTGCNQIQTTALEKNSDNPVGYLLMVDMASSMDAKEFEEAITKYPHMINYNRIQKVRDRLDAREATSAGKKYTDFQFNYNDEVIKLSDYVKPGSYTLVDFWASWCRPCKIEIALVKELYAKYHDKGLNVVGVAVWEKPEATQAYLEENPIPWDILFTGEGQEITDIYGINGIPCIILIDPEGNIVERDLFDNTLIEAVDTAMNPAQ